MNRSRLIFLAALAASWILAITFRLYDLQVRRHEDYSERARRQQQRVVVLHPPRGTLFDARGRELAVSIEVRSVAADPSKMDDPEGAARALGELLGVEEKKLIRDFRSDREFTWVKRKVDMPLVEQVEALDFKGVFTLPESKRYYPMGELAAQVLGYVGTDNKGLAGLEYYYDQVIAGAPGRRKVVRDARYGTARHPGLEGSEADPGLDLYLTLDATIQHLVEQELRKAMRQTGAKRGMVTVLNPNTGAVMALASYPTFDPNRFGVFPKSTWRNQPVEDAYEPGSTFKMVTLAAALEANVVDPLEKIDCGRGGIHLNGTHISDHASFDRLTTRQIIAYSSNVGAIKLGQAAGRERLSETLLRFGFGRPTGIDLPSESAGIVHPLKRWNRLSPAYISFGQSISVTALQLTNAFAAIANGGYLLKPYVVAAAGRHGEVQSWRQREVAGLTIAPSSVRQVRSMLESVVVEGTAKAAAVPGYRVAGKTGTAQKAVSARGYVAGRYVASFVGFAPVNNPALVCSVILDEPWPRYHGGEVAAPVFGAIARQVLLYLGVKPDRQREEPWPKRPSAGASSQTARLELHRSGSSPPGTGLGDVPPGTMPDFTGLSARQAVARSATTGVRIALHGHGQVSQQLPAAGTPLETVDSAVELWLGTEG
jgi:cell division protein FtsI (penicillin-binding protein 3)